MSALSDRIRRDLDDGVAVGNLVVRELLDERDARAIERDTLARRMLELEVALNAERAAAAETAAQRDELVAAGDLLRDVLARIRREVSLPESMAEAAIRAIEGWEHERGAKR